MVGGYKMDFNIMFIGRVILGIGGESMTTAQSIIIYKWFSKRDLAFALGFNTSVMSLGSIVNSFVIPSVYVEKGLGIALNIGAVICLFSFVMSFAIIWLDY